MDVDVEDIPGYHVAYLRHIGPYAGYESLFENMFTRSFTWAGAQKLLNFPETRVLSVYHDNPEITETEKPRTSMCISVPNETNVSGEVGKMELAGGKYAIGHFEISAKQYGDAWDALFGIWLPENDFQPDDRHCFELYKNNPKEHPERKQLVDIFLAVKPL